MIDLTPVLQAVVSLAAVVITAVVIPYVKSKTNSEDQARLKSWVQTAVRAAEQLYPESGSGNEKKAYVLEFLKPHGFTFDSVALDALIESAVNDLIEKEGAKSK